ncbi:GAF domain-containing protein [Rhodococcus sp. HNM0563]|uniref:GAF domain-containing protein n=1 Tax=unclassified Rhodococcus (in: high G+C Gram-positive bacteria) TaxID=192944 RepID=UPI00146A31D8|nr:MULTISPECIES: GAF domain-containing protein [unclassified Rhodococcus (in: high G+C Gram-positive bacteria)]MCK0091709.1 GAF domain-containing protein [Rhodococcus sp. F64268]NLU64047.1 GAF domain-containing protein [Rhodococcus sp. HNM0563]
MDRSTFSAITPGTDLSRYARDLMRMHDTVIGGGKPTMQPRSVVARSWSRVLRTGLDPVGSNVRVPYSPEEIEQRRRSSPLASIIGDLEQVISPVADASQMLLVVTDADGVILWRSGSARVRSRADALGFCVGSVWTEEKVGTNAIGTALAETAPVQLFSGEHFEQSQHPWYCTAAPIHDPISGDLLGIVDVSGPAMTLHPAIGALVDTAVRLAESQLWRQHEQRLDRLRTEAAPLLAAVSGPVLLVDDHGWVAHASGVAATRRVGAPRTDRALTVPGLGLCVPEQLSHGWLIRPSESAATIRMTLRLSSSPTVEVTGTGRQWRSAVTVRHAEILLLLQMRGRIGMSVTELSHTLFGDADHAVAVRAEVSRLRRALGSVVDSRPYRLAESVELSLDLCGAEDVSESAFVLHCAGFGVRTRISEKYSAV